MQRVSLSLPSLSSSLFFAHHLCAQDDGKKLEQVNNLPLNPMQFAHVCQTKCFPFMCDMGYRGISAVASRSFNSIDTSRHVAACKCATTIRHQFWKILCNLEGRCQLAHTTSRGAATLEVFRRPLTLILLQQYRNRNGSHIVIQIGGVYTIFCQEEGILLQKYRDRNGRCIAILFKSISVRGRFDAPEKCFFKRLELPCDLIISGSYLHLREVCLFDHEKSHPMNNLSGPLRLRVQSWSRTRLRIATSIAFLFRTCFKGVLDIIAPLSRGWAPKAV